MAAAPVETGGRPRGLRCRRKTKPYRGGGACARKSSASRAARKALASADGRSGCVTVNGGSSREKAALARSAAVREGRAKKRR